MHINCADYQKISILPPQKGIEFPGGGGGVGGSGGLKHLNKCMEINWNFQRGGGRYGYFLEQHIIYHPTILSGQKTSARPPVRDEYSLISDEWIYESTCPTGRVEFAEKKRCSFLLRSEFLSISDFVN